MPMKTRPVLEYVGGGIYIVGSEPSHKFTIIHQRVYRRHKKFTSENEELSVLREDGEYSENTKLDSFHHHQERDSTRVFFIFIILFDPHILY